MKKIMFAALTVIIAINVKAQSINQDTLTKYSNAAEQLTILNKIAADIHLNSTQKVTFTKLSTSCINRALDILRNKNAGRMEIMRSLRGIGQEYADKMKTLLSPQQFESLKTEREKYHFGKRFITTAK